MATLPQIDTLDGTKITKSERILGRASNSSLSLSLPSVHFRLCGHFGTIFRLLGLCLGLCQPGFVLACVCCRMAQVTLLLSLRALHDAACQQLEYNGRRLRVQVTQYNREKVQEVISFASCQNNLSRPPVPPSPYRPPSSPCPQASVCTPPTCPTCPVPPASSMADCPLVLLLAPGPPVVSSWMMPTVPCVAASSPRGQGGAMAEWHHGDH